MKVVNISVSRNMADLELKDIELSLYDDNKDKITIMKGEINNIKIFKSETSNLTKVCFYVKNEEYHD